jgi:hypothetical protein
MGTAQAGGSRWRRPGATSTCIFTPAKSKPRSPATGARAKAQVTGMVTKILALQAKPISSGCRRYALTLAMCHCWRAPMIAQMAAAQAGAGHRGTTRPSWPPVSTIWPAGRAGGACRVDTSVGSFWATMKGPCLSSAAHIGPRRLKHVSAPHTGSRDRSGNRLVAGGRAHLRSANMLICDRLI